MCNGNGTLKEKALSINDSQLQSYNSKDRTMIYMKIYKCKNDTPRCGGSIPSSLEDAK